MLALDSPRWSELDHAYGPASDIPDLLRALEDLPGSDGESEPWFTLWSALAHQGDVYPASFAAVPHVVRALSSAPDRADEVYFGFPAWVEICRRRTGVGVPFDLKGSYFEALGRLPELVAAAAAREWDSALLASALAAIAGRERAAGRGRGGARALPGRCRGLPSATLRRVAGPVSRRIAAEAHRGPGDPARRCPGLD